MKTNAMALIPTLRTRFSSSPLLGRLARGAFWGGLGTLISRLAAVLASFVLARICGREAFGEYGIVIGAASTLSAVCGMGMGHTVVKYVAEFRETDPEKANQILALTSLVTWCAGLLFGGCFFLFSPYIAENVLANPQLTPSLRIASIGVLLGVFNEVQLASLAGCEAFKAKSNITVLTGIIQAALLCVGCWLFGLIGAIVAYSASYVLVVFLTTKAIAPVWRKFGLRRIWTNLSEVSYILWKFSLPTIMLLLLGFPVSWATNVFLARLPNGYSEVAVINAASPWIGGMVFLITSICTALVPVLSDLVGRKEEGKALKLTWRAVGVSAIISVCATVGVCLFSPIILKMYGDVFVAGKWAFVFAVCSGGVAMIHQPIWNFLVGSGRMWTNFLVVALTAVVQVLLAWYAVKWGAVGLALSKLLAVMFNAIILIIALVVITKRNAKVLSKANVIKGVR